MQPYVVAGLSYLTNRYDEQSLLPLGGSALTILPRSFVKFSASLGAGALIKLPKQFKLGISYRFQYSGNIDTDVGTTGALSLVSPLTINANTHNVILTFSHQIV